MRGETGNEASLHMVATVVLSSSLNDRMKTRLDIELKSTSAVAVATIDMIATTVEQLLQLKFSTYRTQPMLGTGHYLSPGGAGGGGSEDFGLNTMKFSRSPL